MLNAFKILWVPAVISAAVSYLLGSISFSIIFTRMFNNIDIRTLGSGNAGLTNVLRSVGVKAGLFTFIFDFGKGALSVYLSKTIFGYFCSANNLPYYFIQYGAYIAGIACIIGHIYPLYFKFKGGKGILASAGIVLLIDWRIFIIAISVFAVCFAVKRIVSIGSICAAVSFPIANLILTLCDRYAYSGNGTAPISYVWITTVLSAVFSSILIYEHRANIIRIKNGTEKTLTIKRN